MKVISITSNPLDYFVKMGKIPKGIKWSAKIPTSYSLNLVKDTDETKTILVCTGSFGGRISYATYDGNISLPGRVKVLESDEIVFLMENYPELFSEMDKLSWLSSYNQKKHPEKDA